MKSIGVFVLLSACALTSASLLTSVPKVADDKIILQQRTIFELLSHVHQKELHNKHWELVKDWELMKNMDHFTQPEVVEKFWKKWQVGMLTTTEIFDVTNKVHWKQAMVVYDLLNATKDWDTFHKTMVWLRYHISTEMFVYVLTSVIIHNERFAGLEMPAPYEIQPQYFFNAQTIRKAQREKMQRFENLKMVDGMHDLVLLTNYTDSKLMLNDEQRLAYFHEDIGLNSWYYYMHMDYPFWMDADNDKTWNDRRGEFYLWMHWHLMQRYHLERLSNGMHDTKEFSWDEHLPTGYYPQMTYMNGEKFPARGNYYNLKTPKNLENIEWVKTWERRLVEAIDRGYAIMDCGKKVNITEDIEELAKVFMALPHTGYSKYYGKFLSMSKRILSAPVTTIDWHTVIPGVMQHYQTALRDPMFYQLYKRIMKKLMHWQKQLPSYNKEDLDFKGVEIKSVEMDKLITYFDLFEADITNAVDVAASELNDGMENFMIKARNRRLNHLPFTVKLNVNSNKAQKSVVQMFVASKYDAYGHVYRMEDNRENFYLMGKWIVDLKEGMNMITRESSTLHPYVKDRTQFRTMMKNVMNNKWEMKNTEAHCGFPERLMLPRGKKEGMPFEFFFVVAPYMEPAAGKQTWDKNIVCGIGAGNRWMESRPFGWPFDRPIKMENWWTPNMYMHEAKIFHKKQSEINSAQ